MSYGRMDESELSRHANGVRHDVWWQDPGGQPHPYLTDFRTGKEKHVSELGADLPPIVREKYESAPADTAAAIGGALGAEIGAADIAQLQQ